jgi:hypothetical protein
VFRETIFKHMSYSNFEEDTVVNFIVNVLRDLTFCDEKLINIKVVISKCIF